MAYKITDRGLVFLQKLVAPLPEFEEQVATPKFLKQIERDMKQVWRLSMEGVEYAQALHRIAAINFRNNPDAKSSCWGPGSQELMDAYKAACERCEAQCLIPAPTPAEMRWKKRWAKNRKVSDEVTKAILADEDRFASQAPR